MNKIKNKFYEIIKDRELYIFLIITMIFFGIFSIMQYAPDTYSVYANSLRDTIIHFLSCGRIASAIFVYIVKGLLNIDNQGMYIISYIIAIICTVISLYKLNKLIKKDIKDKSCLSIIISTLIIINPFSLELFLYIEKGIMMLSVLLCVLAVEQVEKFLEGNKSSLVVATIFMFVANACYQGTVGLFVIISLIYILKYSKNIKKFIENNIIVALIYGFSAIFNFAIIKVFFNNSRVTGTIILSESLQKIIKGLENLLIDSYDLLPKYLFLFVIVILFIYEIYKSISTISKKNSIKEMIIYTMGCVYILLVSILVTVAPQIIQDTNSIWFVARSSYPIAAIIGILILYILMNFEIKKVEENILIIMLVLFSIIQFQNFTTYSIDNYIGNYLDKTISLEIKGMINQYEEETGEKIEEMSIYKDRNIQYTHSGLKASGDINVKAYCADWCISSIIKLYTNKDLKIVENNQSIKEDFLQKDWNYFCKEQILFENNTMHICIF